MRAISPQVLVFIAIFSCIFSQFFIWYEVRGPMNLIISSVLRKLGSCIYKCLGNTMLTSFSIHKRDLFPFRSSQFQVFFTPILSVISKYYAPSYFRHCLVELNPFLVQNITCSICHLLKSLGLYHVLSSEILMLAFPPTLSPHLMTLSGIMPNT